MKFDEFLQTATFSLSEGSIYERLRRNPSVEFDPYLYHATLIYKPEFAKVLEQVHREYLDVGQKHKLPMFALTDTWRANQERIMQSDFRDRMVNQDNAQFLVKLRDGYVTRASPIFIGGIVGFSLVGLAIETLGTRTSFIVSAMVVFSAILLVFLAQKQPAMAKA